MKKNNSYVIMSESPTYDGEIEFYSIYAEDGEIQVFKTFTDAEKVFNKLFDDDNDNIINDSDFSIINISYLGNLH